MNDLNTAVQSPSAPPAAAADTRVNRAALLVAFGHALTIAAANVDADPATIAELQSVYDAAQPAVREKVAKEPKVFLPLFVNVGEDTDAIGFTLNISATEGVYLRDRGPGNAVYVTEGTGQSASAAYKNSLPLWDAIRAARTAADVCRILMQGSGVGDDNRNCRLTIR